MSDFPRMLFAKDGSTLTVNSAEEEHGAGSHWSRHPSEVHFAPKAPDVPATAAVTDVMPSGRDDFVEMLIARMREEFPSLADDTDAATDGDTETHAPRRGRPRKTS
jgi:hypothetical protein